jgi:hypothetical protein
MSTARCSAKNAYAMVVGIALVTGGVSYAQDADPKKIDSSDAPAVAHRLWSDLACRCGRCKRLRFVHVTAQMQLVKGTMSSTAQGTRSLQPGEGKASVRDGDGHLYLSIRGGCTH